MQLLVTHNQQEQCTNVHNWLSHILYSGLQHESISMKLGFFLFLFFLGLIFLLFFSQVWLIAAILSV